MKRFIVLALSSTLALSACGGAPAGAPAEAPAPSSAPAEPAPEAKEASAPAEPAAEPAPEPSKPLRTPIDIITAPKLAFVINHPSSALQEAAEKKCASVAQDPAKRAACMQKERGRFPADVLQFKKDTEGTLWWIIYRRKGTALTVVSRSSIELSDEKDDSVTVNIVGKDKMQRILFPTRGKFVVTVPNEYSIEIDEPRYGKLVYDAKIDIVEQ